MSIPWIGTSNESVVGEYTRIAGGEPVSFSSIVTRTSIASSLDAVESVLSTGAVSLINFLCVAASLRAAFVSGVPCWTS